MSLSPVCGPLVESASSSRSPPPPPERRRRYNLRPSSFDISPHNRHRRRSASPNGDDESPRRGRNFSRRAFSRQAHSALPPRGNDISLSSPDGRPSQPQLKINLQKVGGSSDTTIKTYHIVEWNGKKYRLTQTYNDGAKTQQIGFTQKDWEAIAEKQIAIWEEVKRVNSQFSFSNASFNIENGTLNFRTSAGQPVETIDFNNLSSTSYATIEPAIVQAAQDLFHQKKIKPRPMQFIRGNPPKPTLASEQKPERPINPPENPINPPLPEPEEIEWYRLDKKIKNFFTKTFSNPT